MKIIILHKHVVKLNLYKVLSIVSDVKQAVKNIANITFFLSMLHTHKNNHIIVNIFHINRKLNSNN